MKDIEVERKLTGKLDAFFDGKYVSLDICDVFYKITRGFFNENQESHIGIGIYPSSNNHLTIHFLKCNEKNDMVKIESRRNIVICPITECLLKNTIELSKLKRSGNEEEHNYIQ